MFRVISEPNIDYKESIRFVNPVSAITGDPYAGNVALYLKGENLLDSSPSPKLITNYGSVAVSSVKSKYGGSSIYFNGGQALSTPYITDFQINNSNTCTIEFWIYPTNLSGFYEVIATGALSGPTASSWVLLSNNLKIAINTNSNGTSGWTGRLESSNCLLLNQWQLITFVKVGTNYKFYHNGILVMNLTESRTIFSSPTYLHIGGIETNSLNKYVGYIDSLRFTSNIARYTSNFDPELDTYLAY